MATSEHVQNTYRRNLPPLGSVPVVHTASWKNGATPTLTIDPDSAMLVMMDKLIMVYTDDLALNGADTVDIDNWGDDGASVVSISAPAKLASLGKVTPFIDGDNWIRVEVDLKPPIKLTDAGTEVFTISNSGGATQAMTGNIHFTVLGWTFTEASY